jgi:ammonia channel protein AmtB
VSRLPARLVPLRTAGIVSRFSARLVPVRTAGIVSRFSARLVPVRMGGLLTGVLANPDMLLYIGTDKDAPGINATGWYYGNFTQLKYQAIAALFIIVLNAVGRVAEGNFTPPPSRNRT